MTETTAHAAAMRARNRPATAMRAAHGAATNGVPMNALRAGNAGTAGTGKAGAIDRSVPTIAMTDNAEMPATTAGVTAGKNGTGRPRVAEDSAADTASAAETTGKAARLAIAATGERTARRDPSGTARKDGPPATAGAIARVPPAVIVEPRTRPGNAAAKSCPSWTPTSGQRSLTGRSGRCCAPHSRASSPSWSRSTSSR